MKIRAAEEADLSGIAAIYDHEIASGLATFDLAPRPLSAWREALESAAPGDHFLVAEDDEDAIAGFAYSSAYRPRAGYRYTRETALYLAPGAQGQGLGRTMYDDLLRWLVADGIHLAVAVIALPNPASRALHRACGFEEVGVMREVGRKFDKWVDTLLVQKVLT